MAKWHSASLHQPPSDAFMRVKGARYGGEMGDQPFQGYARWHSALWIGKSGVPFLPEDFQITHWKEDDPSEPFFMYSIAGLGAKDVDRSSLHAQFSWEEKGKQHTKRFSKDDLEHEISRREAGGVDIPPEFHEALDWLQDPYRPRRGTSN